MALPATQRVLVNNFQNTLKCSAHNLSSYMNTELMYKTFLVC